MKKLELSVLNPGLIPLSGEDWKPINERLMRFLREEPFAMDSAEVCNATLEELYPERSLKDLSVMVFRTDMPSVINFVKKLKVVGNGECNTCGSNDISHNYGRFSDEKLCNVCGSQKIEYYDN